MTMFKTEFLILSPNLAPPLFLYIFVKVVFTVKTLTLGKIMLSSHSLFIPVPQEAFPS